MDRKIAAFLVAASLIASGVASAQQPPAEPKATPGGPPDSMMNPGMMMGPGMMGHGHCPPWMMGPHGRPGLMTPGMIEAYAEGKLAFIKSLLEITEAQSSVWNSFADAVRAQAKSMAEAEQKRVPAAGQAESTLPEWLDQRIQMMDEHLAAMRKVKPAVDRLYQALTPEQRQKADQVIRIP